MPREKHEKTEVQVDVEGRTMKLSNLEKVLYPRTGTTKGEVLNYYARIAPVMLPHLADRAVTRIRWPHGTEDMSFFEKNIPNGTPSWVHTVKVPTTGSRTASKQDGTLIFPIVDDLATLTWLVNLAALELHVHQWTVGRNGRPRNADRLVIDLDPGEPAGLHECCQVALLVRDALADKGLDAKPVTSGSKGLHLYADLPRRLPSDESTALAKDVAEALQKEHAALVTATMTKAKRPGKVFLDWSQNSGSKTTISPYSLRGRERPWVATPVAWDEVEAGAEDDDALGQFRFDEVLDRVERARGPVRGLSRRRSRPERVVPDGARGTRAGSYYADMAQRVVIVEDEEDIAFPLVRTLEREGYDVQWLDSGQKALDDLQVTKADVVILDLGLPDMDGLEVCRKMRDQGYDGAIMIVTARAGELDRVVGLDYGADDYMSKPFGLAELQARVRALLRRTSGASASAEDAVPPGGLRIDIAARRVFSGTDEVPLTGKEFEVLSVLAANRDKVVSRDRLMADVWDENWYGSTKTLDVTIGRLRQKLESVGVTEKVVAVRGVGFRLEGAPTAS